MLVALICALVANVTYGLGTILQALGARRATTAAGLDLALFARLARERFYLGGLGLDAIGFVASIVALRTLPLFVVQTAIAGSVGVTALAAVVVFGYRLRATDKIAIGALIAGLVLLGASAQGESASHLSSLGGWLLLAGVAGRRRRRRSRRAHARPTRRIDAGRVRRSRLHRHRGRRTRPARPVSGLAHRVRTRRDRTRALRRVRDADVRERAAARLGDRRRRR